MHFSSSRPCLKNMTTGFSSPLTSLYSMRTIMPLGSIDSPVKNCKSSNFPRRPFITPLMFFLNSSTWSALLLSSRKALHNPINVLLELIHLVSLIVVFQVLNNLLHVVLQVGHVVGLLAKASL